MKLVKLAAICSLLVGSAGATTISVGGGTASSPFVTSTGVTLTAANSTFAMGTYNGTTFTPFATTDATPMVIGTAAFAGKLTGNFSDNSDTATAFNNQIIWLRVNVDLGGGATGLAYIGGPDTGVLFPAISTKFPVNGNGANDSLAFETRNLTVVGAGSTAGTAGYNGTNIVIGVIPEPSVALLGVLGMFGFLRRRR